MKRNPNDYGNPKGLNPEDIDGDTVIVTIHRVDDYKGFGSRPQVGITTAEFPDKVLYLNRSMLTIITNKLGAEDREWIGQRLPLEVVQVRNPETKQDVARLYPVNETQWDSVLEQAERAQARSTGRKRAAAK